MFTFTSVVVFSMTFPNGYTVMVYPANSQTETVDIRILNPGRKFIEFVSLIRSDKQGTVYQDVVPSEFLIVCSIVEALKDVALG